MIERIVKVAYILTPITFGGSEKVSLNFLRTVDRKRFDIRPILLTRPWEEEPLFAREIVNLGYSYVSIPVALVPGFDPIRVLRVAYRLFLTLGKGAFDVVHTHGYFADICGLPSSRLLGLPCISTCHGFIPNDRKLKIYNLIDSFVLRLCGMVITVSDAIKFGLINSGIQASRIVVIPNAVATSYCAEEASAFRRYKRRYLGIDLKEYVVGYIGRLSLEKGVSHLIDAVAELRDTGIAVKLLVIGDGLERSNLEQQAKMRSLGHSVIFAGFQSDAEKWFSSIDIFVLPSLTEGTPMALLEAMAAGVPVIATAVGGVPNVVTDGVDGLLVPPANSISIGQKIYLLMNNETLKYQIINAGFETIKNRFSINSWCHAIENCYYKLCN